MRTVRICNPVAGEPFPCFQHHTTTYVAIPHGHPSLLFIQPEQSCWLTIQSEARPVMERRLTSDEVAIDLAELPAPGRGNTLAKFLLAPLAHMAGRPKHVCPDRLYAFTVTLHADTRERPIIATYDFHILCPEEYEQARTCDRELRCDPQAISPDTISERTEGRHCAHCTCIRASMHGTTN